MIRNHHQSKNQLLLATLLILAIAISSSYAAQITIPKNPIELTETKITISETTFDSGLILRLTSRNLGTTEHFITWKSDGTGEVILNDLTKGSYIASLNNKSLSLNKPLRVKAFTVGGK